MIKNAYKSNTKQEAGNCWPLGELAEIRFGVKSGKDEFFFPRDVSRECLGRVPAFHQFQQEFGIDRECVESGEVKLVKCGEGYGEIRPIEARYLEPEIHSLMEVKGYTVSPKDCGRMILLASEPKSKLKGTYLLRYIEWGESKGYHKGSTCAARVTAERGWYDLTGHPRGELLWPMAQQYKHAIPFNEHQLQANHNLFDIITRNNSHEYIGGILNSSFVVLSKFLYGRPVGNEGNLKTEVIDVTMMPVPDSRGRPPSVLRKIAEAFGNLKKRPAMQFLSERRLRRMAFAKSGREAELQALSDLTELDMADRRALDDAILEMLGVKSQRERDGLISGLYAYLGEFFEGIRQKEEKAIANKNKAKRKAAFSPAELAAQILAEIKDNQGQLLRSYADFVDMSRPFSTFDLPTTGVPEIHEDMFAPQGSVRFMKGRKQIYMLPTKTPEQAALVVVIATHGGRGLTRVPLDSKDCVSLKKRYETFIDDRAKRLKSMIADRTGDPDLRDRIFDALNDLILHETSA